MPIIRPAKYSDISSLMEISKEVIHFMQSMGNVQWDSEYPGKEVFLNDLEEESLFVLASGEQIIGSIVLNSAEPVEYRDVKWLTVHPILVIHRMMIHESFRGIGLSKLLLRFAENHAGMVGISGLRTDTNCHNTPMIALFSSCGFIKSGEINLRNVASKFYCYEKIIV